MDAKEGSEIHSKQRLVQRYGVRLSREQLREVVQRIQRGQAIPLKKSTNSRTVFAVEVGRDSTIVPVVYSSTRKAIVTVLPETVLARHATRIRAARTRRANHDSNGEPIQFEEDQRIPRFKLIDNNPMHKLKAYFYFKETSEGRLISYVESNKVCASGRVQVFALLQRQLEQMIANRPPECRAETVQRFLNRLEAGLAAIGLGWEALGGEE